MPSYTVEVELVRKVQVEIEAADGVKPIEAVTIKALSQLTDKDRRDATRTRVTEVKTEVGEWTPITPNQPS